MSIKVLKVKDNQVKVDIHAPNSLHVHHEEIYVCIEKERKVDKGRR
ncbi:carbon storage regulator [Microbulbifer sp. JMSA008]